MADTSAGHLSVRVEGLHPADVPFLFEQQPQRLGPSLVGSFVFQALIATLFIVASRYAPASPAAFLPEQPNSDFVWLPEPGPSGGGGGGGNKKPEPSRQAELPGKDKLTVPIEKPPEIVQPKPETEDQPPPLEELILTAQTLAAAENTRAGIIDPGPSSSSQGSGANGGGGTGARGGIGESIGSGLGPGGDRGIGGDAYRPGNGVTLPVELYVPKPQYTPTAMRARIQGTVLVECVVQTSGTCTNTRVVRSLDPTFGLDQEALEAAQLFRFRPGMRMGEPVPVLVTIELSFSLH